MIYQKLFSRITLFVFILLQSCSKNPFSPEIRDILAHQNRRTLGNITNQYLQSPSAEIRYRLCLAMANSRDTLLIPNLELLLKDCSPTVRGGAVFALGQMVCHMAESLLVRHWAVESDAEVRQNTAIALAQIGSPASLNRLLETTMSDANDYPVEALVYFFQRQIYNPASVRYAISVLRSGNPHDARWAALALSRIRDRALMRELAGDLQDALSTPDPATRIKLVACLAPLNFTGKAEIWPQLLTDHDPRIRIEAARGLAQLSDNAEILTRILSDSISQVVATAIENLPDSLHLTVSLKADFKTLSRHPSLAVQSALVKYLSRRGGLNALRAFDLWPLRDLLLPAVAEGLAAYENPSGLSILDSLSRHNCRAISTPAYLGLLSMAEQLHQHNVVSVDELGKYIVAGMQSGDPVKIAIAAEIMRNSVEIYRKWESLLYPQLNHFNNSEYADAILEILKTIAILRPTNGAVNIQPLSNARNSRIRELARQTLTDVYGINTEKSPDDYYGAGRYSNLTRLKKYGLRPIVLLETERGNIIIRLDGYYAPFTVDAFLAAIEKGFYNGFTFHRVVPNFVVQGGDPRGDGWGGPGYTLLTEFSPIGYDPGAVGMARADFDTEGSQFFITLTDQPHLNYKYTRFGEVIDGLSVAARLEKGDRILAISVLN